MAELSFTGVFNQEQQNQDWAALTNKMQQEREARQVRAREEVMRNIRRQNLKAAYPDARESNQALEWDSEINEPEAKRKKQRKQTGDIYKDVFAPAWKLASEFLKNVNGGWAVSDWAKPCDRWAVMLDTLEPGSPEQVFVNALEAATLDYVNAKQQQQQEPESEPEPEPEAAQEQPEEPIEEEPAPQAETEEAEEEQFSFL